MQGSKTTQFHVAPTGSDANPGTREKPLATLSAARDATRRLKRDGLKTPVEVIVQAGTYYLAEPLTFSPEDSGTQECPITYKADDGAKVVLSGGKPLAGWRQVNDKLWALDTPPGLPDFRLLRIGERWAIRARYPNYDPAHPYTGGWLFADWDCEPWERGQFNVGVRNTHNVNARLTWKVRTAADGNYRVWLRYAHNMKLRNGRSIRHPVRRRQSDPATRSARHRRFERLPLVARGRPDPHRGRARAAIDQPERRQPEPRRLGAVR